MDPRHDQELNSSSKKIKKFFLSNAPEEITYTAGVPLEFFNLGGETVQQATPILWNCIDSCSGFLRTGIMLFDDSKHHVNETRVKMTCMFLSDLKQFYCSAVNDGALNKLFNTTYLPGIPVSFALTTLVDFVFAINDTIRAISKSNSFFEKNKKEFNENNKNCFDEWLEDSLEELVHLRKIKGADKEKRRQLKKRIRQLEDDIKRRIRIYSKEILLDKDTRPQDDPDSLYNKIIKYQNILPKWHPSGDPDKWLEKQLKKSLPSDTWNEERLKSKLEDHAIECIVNCAFKGFSFFGMTLIAFAIPLAAAIGVSVATVTGIGWLLAGLATVNYLNNNFLCHYTEKKTHQFFSQQKQPRSKPARSSQPELSYRPL